MIDVPHVLFSWGGDWAIDTGLFTEEYALMLLQSAFHGWGGGKAFPTNQLTKIFHLPHSLYMNPIIRSHQSSLLPKLRVLLISLDNLHMTSIWNVLFFLAHLGEFASFLSLLSYNNPDPSLLNISLHKFQLFTHLLVIFWRFWALWMFQNEKYIRALIFFLKFCWCFTLVYKSA